MDARDQYRDFWESWEDHIQSRADAAPLISAASDENLVAILSAGARTDREDEQEAIAAEVLQRLVARQHKSASGAFDVLRAARAAYAAAVHGQRPLNAANAILHAEGDEALGKNVAASATSSLLATKLAYRVALDHAADVEETQAQSRVSEALAENAAVTARIGSETTRHLEAQMTESGHGREGKAAGDAARDIAVAADAATRAAQKNRRVEEGRPGAEPDA